MNEPHALPSVRIVRGEPDEIELAALVAGLVATRTPDVEDIAVNQQRWTDPARRVRGAGPRRQGPDAWRWSFHD